MDAIMVNGAFRLKGQALLALGKLRGIENAHQIHLRSGVSWPTIYRYIENPDQVQSINLDSLAGFLIDGLGLSPDEVVGLKFGDVFEYVPSEKKG